ncbi:G-type lectin S-receptor-like serine/threonine-protein kinase At4g03230 isoform X1 [Quercus lobata]|uniref:G-type lectin S-receptor-like serine/threonine-protein kinase At4g03230 isoform X1 n=1 Tax=Quercus lobata TaxID=97700 RepID=UPI0012462417|nr:G-type lectin S-receptor-like serine/threonine-protein kinase At4g03230 isoform X1 [Quercus lobata]
MPCWIWKQELVNLQEEYEGGYNISIRVAISDIENRQIDQRNRVQRILYSESYVQDLIDSGEFQEEDEKGIDVPFYDLESIRDATNNFSDENKLGQGGYGPVYEGKLPSGQEIAVKRLSFVSGQGLQEFKNEVVLLQHRNLVRLWILHKRE